MDRLPSEVRNRLLHGGNIPTASPLFQLEEALEGLREIANEWSIDPLQIRQTDTSQHKRFAKFCTHVAVRAHLSIVAKVKAFIIEFQEVKRGERLLESQHPLVFQRSLEDLLRELEHYKESEHPGPIVTNEVFASQLHNLHQACRSVLSNPDSTGKGYGRLRKRLIAANPYFLPLTVLVSESAKDYHAALHHRGVQPEKRASLLDAEFEEVLQLATKQDQRPSVAPSRWTGRRTVKQQVMLIREFAPVVLGSLDELIELHRRLLHNQELEPAQAEALALLRQLHADIGELLAAVDSGRPFKTLVSKVKKLGQALFSLRRDTQELVMLGMPTMSATGLTLGVVKGLELISGFSLGETETAAIVTIAGGTYTALSVAKHVSENRPKID